MMMPTHLKMRSCLWLCLFTILDCIQVDAFLATASLRNTLGSSASPSALDCICIDCKWVTSCKAYHFVEKKHKQPHMTDEPTFLPRDGSPKIHVNIRNVNQQNQEEVDKLFREHADETNQALEAQQQKGGSGTAPVGNTKYDLTPQVTYEYDVVACEDFVEDKGAWVRNMPEEIKKANPDFVPT